MKLNNSEYISLIQRALESSIPGYKQLYEKLYDSMKYSLLAPGKKVRPLLTLLFCELCSGDINKALPFACAVEMIHTFSLIHDDLPCMDDDDMRRGRKSNHIVYGEDMALLAGDNLMSLAFETILKSECLSEKDMASAFKAARILSTATRKMIEGQVIDLKCEGREINLEVLKEMDEKKTCALIAASCEMGCVIAGASEEEIEASREFAMCIGMAFQIMDDILDVTADEANLGKPVGSDVFNNKSNYVSILGIDKSRELVSEYTNRAIEVLDKFIGDTSRLKDLAVALSSREK